MVVAWRPVEQPPDRPDPGTEPGRPVVGRRAVLAIGLTGISGAALAGCATGSDRGAGAVKASTAGAQPTPGAATTSPTSPARATTSSASTATTKGPPRIALTPGPDITHGPRTGDQVALTFHGQGPESMARDILAACASAEAEVTVFAVGTWLQQYPHVGRAVVAAGHELGNHTWSHQQMKQLSRSQAVDEAERGARALKAPWALPAGGSGPPAPSTALRPSGPLPPQPGTTVVCPTTSTPRTSWTPGRTRSAPARWPAVRPGSVVSLHFGHQGTVDALPGILAGLQAKGLRPVTLSTLLQEQ